MVCLAVIWPFGIIRSFGGLDLAAEASTVMAVFYVVREVIQTKRKCWYPFKDLPRTSKGLWIGQGGARTVTMSGDGCKVRILGVRPGTKLEIGVSKVWRTGTHCDRIVAFY